MKVILLQDVYKKGVAGEVVKVAPGYARNYLIPRGMAAQATAGVLRQLQNLRKSADERRVQYNKESEIVADKVQALTLYFPVKASETGKLYGSVTSAEIAEQLKEKIGLDIDRRRIGDRPLRELGTFPVVVRLDAGLTPTVTVVVHREGESPVQAAAEEAAEEAVEEAAGADVVEAVEPETADPGENGE
jgi:large subunit ribosomal protein L9